jgi:hypothetical protein
MNGKIKNLQSDMENRAKLNQVYQVERMFMNYATK